MIRVFLTYFSICKLITWVHYCMLHMWPQVFLTASIWGIRVQSTLTLAAHIYQVWTTRGRTWSRSPTHSSVVWFKSEFWMFVLRLSNLSVTFHFWCSHICAPAKCVALTFCHTSRPSPRTCPTLQPSALFFFFFCPRWQRHASCPGVFVLQWGGGGFSCWVSRGRASVREQLHLALLSFYITLACFI